MNISYQATRYQREHVRHSFIKWDESIKRVLMYEVDGAGFTIRQAVLTDKEATAIPRDLIERAKVIAGRAFCQVEWSVPGSLTL